MIHGFPEIAAYFITALAGGIFGVGVLKNGIKSSKFLRLMEQRKKLHTSLPDIEELDIWCKTVLEVSKKLIKNTSWDKKYYDKMKKFEEIYKTSIALNLDLPKLIELSGPLYEKIIDRFK